MFWSVLDTHHHDTERCYPRGPKILA